jgi:eukaryotic-like serine/threonine-protein kinase
VLIPGTRLGAYEILATLGEGGMGAVYRARDTKLNRDVAIKVLLPEVASNPERLVRFQREAQVLAALNHPHIAQIYGLEEQGPADPFLVLELVEGPTLADRIARGPIPLDEALPIARQIAEALEAAHEQGIIHRDLKPANIKVRPDGTVKVLDFGLAKALESPSSAPSGAGVLSNSPTLTSPALVTGAGVLLGTAAYMSPEQARGRTVDKRADIWAFGAVFFEMLTGTRVFPGEDVTDTLALVVRGEPAWDALPAEVPPRVRQVLRSCLQKDARQRLGDAQSVRLALDGAFETAAPPAAVGAPPAVARPFWKRAIPVVAAALVAGAVVGATAWMRWPAPGPQPVARFIHDVGADRGFRSAGRRTVALSPDGSRVVSNVSGGLVLRAMDQVDGRLLQGTEAALTGPVFSSDGRWVAYWQEGQIKKIAVDGGVPVTLCAAADNPQGITWAPDDSLLFAQPDGIQRVSAAGGTPALIVKAGDDEQFAAPQVLPGGEWVLFTRAPRAARTADAWDAADIVVQSLRSSERKVLVSGGTDGLYVPPGHLVYAVQGVLFAVPFDLSRLAVTGGRVPIVQGVRRSASGAFAQVSISTTGTLVFVPGPSSPSGAQTSLGIFDRKGQSELLKIPPGRYELPRLSPDGRHIAVGTDDGDEASIWIYDLAGRSALRRLTLAGQGRNRYPVWSPDSQRVAFQSDRDKDLGLFWQRADGTGTAERLTTAEKGTAHIPESWGAGTEGERLLYSAVTGSTTALWMWSSRDRKAALFGAIQSPASTLTGAVWSPDGRWVAYASREGRATSAVYVQPVPPTGARYQISRDAEDGHHPVWSPDGRELFYTPGPQAFINAVLVTTQPSFSFTEATPVAKPFLSDAPSNERPYDISRDGTRFLGLIDAAAARNGAPAAAQVEIVLNWAEDLKRLVPSGAR